MINLYLKLKTAKEKVVGEMKSFNNDERGMSEIVAAILLIVLVVGIALAVWPLIQTWVENTWNNISSSTDSLMP